MEFVHVPVKEQILQGAFLFLLTGLLALLLYYENTKYSNPSLSQFEQFMDS